MGFLGIEHETLLQICQLLSTSVIGMSLMMKFPQIRNVVNSKSTAGLSFSSQLLVLWTLSVIVSYQFGKGYPLNNYLDGCFLLCQDLILVLLMFHDRKMFGPKIFLGIIGYAVFMYCSAYGYIPDAVMKLFMSSLVPCSASSKLIQLKNIYQTKDAGQLSATTWGLMVYGASARTFTSLVQTGDIVVAATSIQHLVLSICLVCAILYYGKKDDKKKA